MKPGSISTALLAIACLVAAALSASILGPGMWAVALTVAGLAFAASPYVPSIQPAVRAVALVGGVLALLAVALGLLAATTGGSFRLPDDQAALLAALAAVGILGIVVNKSLGISGDVT